MTLNVFDLESAIRHCEEVAEQHERKKALTAVTLEACRCADEHRQLAEWLKELKAKRKQVEILAESLNGCPQDAPCDEMCKPDGWCERHCKEKDLTHPDTECWLRYAETMANYD